MLDLLRRVAGAIDLLCDLQIVVLTRSRHIVVLTVVVLAMSSSHEVFTARIHVGSHMLHA